MRFCTTCGSALEFFEFLEGELCSSCLEAGKSAPRKTTEAKEPPIDPGIFTDAVLLREGNKLVLKSQEGWVLWSAPDSDQYQLQDVLTKARRILEIRRKRRKK